jgi:hypothetical protein
METKFEANELDHDQQSEETEEDEKLDVVKYEYM